MPTQYALFLASPELDAVFDFAFELGRRHVRLVPAIVRDHALIGLGGVVDDGEEHGKISLIAAANHRRPPRGFFSLWPVGGQESSAPSSME